MKLNLGSLAFGSTLNDGVGTPSWGTELGQSRPDYKFTTEGCENILMGMLYNSVSLTMVSLPLGRGGTVKKAFEFSQCQLASVFRKVYVNDVLIGYPFVMALIKEESESHMGRRSIKYSDKMEYESDGERISNLDFFRETRKKFNLTWDACWFIYEVNVINLDELRFKAVIVDPKYTIEYNDSVARKNDWISRIPN